MIFLCFTSKNEGPKKKGATLRVTSPYFSNPSMNFFNLLMACSRLSIEFA